MDVWSYSSGQWQPGDLESAETRWFDVLGSADDLGQLAIRFGLHPLSIEDCLSDIIGLNFTSVLRFQRRFPAIISLTSQRLAKVLDAKGTGRC